MEYAIELLLPIALGFWAGMWLHQTFNASPLWIVLFCVLGMAAGIGLLYKRLIMTYSPKDPKTFKLPPPPTFVDDDPDDD